MFGFQERERELLNQSRNLMEIIRWHINPQTAESPFFPTKNQRDEHPGRQY